MCKHCVVWGYGRGGVAEPKSREGCECECRWDKANLRCRHCRHWNGLELEKAQARVMDRRNLEDGASKAARRSE